jgi:diguanylate cyclase (GGDEF)-like protein
LTHGRCDPCRSPGEPCPLLETVATGKHAAADHLHVLGGKRKIVVEISTSPIFDDQGQVARVVHVTRDISERKRIETMLTEQARKLEQLALIDALTGLNNRRGFLTLAGQQLRIADRFGKRLHLLFADLDGMKWINDTLGHSEGDRALRETAELLRRTFRESDILARIGGDEFAVLALGEDKSEEGTIRSRFEEQLVAHNDSADRGYRLSISIGITVYDPSVPCSIEQLLDRGDALMYEQKRLQKQCDPR